MEKRKFGNTDMEITTIGFGAWAIGGGNWAYAWGEQDDKESIDTIHAALEAGMNWIDTAAVYGLGHSEEVVAKAMEGIPQNDRPYIFTKCSLIWGEDREVGSSLKKESIRREVEDSLRRLKVETIDLYQIHWPNPEPDIEEGWETLAELKKEGKLRWIGVSNFNVEQMNRIKDIAPISSLQPPYSAVFPSVQDEILPYCLENNIGVIVYSPMASGLLTGKFSKEYVENLADNDWRKGAPHFQEPQLSRNLALADIMAEIAEAHGEPTPAASVAWTLENPAVTAAIVGARRPDQIPGFIGAGDMKLTDEEKAKVSNFIKDNPIPA